MPKEEGREKTDESHPILTAVELVPLENLLLLILAGPEVVKTERCRSVRDADILERMSD